jgi:four helix bundle protein
MRPKHLDQLASIILDFTVDVMKASDRANSDPQATLLLHQLVRATLAAGSSYRWGRRASHKREFINRLSVSRSEFEEITAWLEMVAARHDDEVWKRSLATARNINQILIASLDKARQRSKDIDDE